MEFNYFCIYSKGKVPPLGIVIKTSESDKFKLFSSEINQFPSTFNCEKIYEVLLFFLLTNEDL